MRKSSIITAVALALLFAAANTSYAQNAKKVERKTVIVTVTEDGEKRDTTIIEGDSLKFEGGDLIIETREGKRIIRKPGEGSRMVWAGDAGTFPGRAGAPGTVKGRAASPAVIPGRALNRVPEVEDGINYRIAVDGVVVNIRAPKEKAKEADQILLEVKKVLMKK